VRHDLSEWANEKKDINVTELNKLVAEMFAARKDYDYKKADSDAAYDIYEQKESLVLKALLSTGLKKYEAPGMPGVSITKELSPQVPKTVEDKRLFFNYIEKEFGTDYLENVLSINANTVKSLYNKILKEHEGSTPPVIPGITQITEFTKLNRGKKE
jgi:hypothetical protein